MATRVKESGAGFIAQRAAPQVPDSVVQGATAAATNTLGVGVIAHTVPQNPRLQFPSSAVLSFPALETVQEEEACLVDPVPECIRPAKCWMTQGLIKPWIDRYHDPRRVSQWQKCAAAVERVVLSWTGGVSLLGEDSPFFLHDYLFYIGIYHKRGDLISSLNDPGALVVAYIYLNRLVSRGEIGVTQSNAVQLLAASLFLSMKWLQDDVYADRVFSKMAGFDLADFRKIEISLCRLLDFNLFVREEEFQRALKALGMPALPPCSVSVPCSLRNRKIAQRIRQHDISMGSDWWRKCSQRIQRDLCTRLFGLGAPVLFAGGRKLDFALSDYLFYLGMVCNEYNLINFNRLDSKCVKLIYSSYIYVNRLLVKNTIAITPSNLVQLMAVSLCVSLKWHRIPFSQKGFATIAGFNPVEFNALKDSFCELLDDDFLVGDREFRIALNSL